MFLLNLLEDLNLIPFVRANLLHYPDAIRRAIPSALPCVNHEDNPLLDTALPIDDVAEASQRPQHIVY